MLRQWLQRQQRQKLRRLQPHLWWVRKDHKVHEDWQDHLDLQVPPASKDKPVTLVILARPDQLEELEAAVLRAHLASGEPRAKRGPQD